MQRLTATTMHHRLPSAVRRSYATKGKDILFGTEVRQRMLDGVALLNKAVSVTLGPKGRNVVIEQAYGAPKITKDGVTVAKSIEFKEPFRNMGAQLARQVANTANEAAGDGTTTATLLTHSIFAEGYKYVQQGTSPVDIKRGIDRATQEVLAALQGMSKPISTKEEIAQVATISANGDKELGQLISQAMEKVGKDGVITTSDGKTLSTELEVVEGLSLDRGYISPYFVTNSKLQNVQFEDCFVLVSQKKFSSVQQLLPLLNVIARTGRSLLIVAEDVDSEALSTLIYNKLQGMLRVCAVKAPGFGDNKTAMLGDIAVFTGAQVLSDETGTEFDAERPDESMKLLGTAKKVTVTKDSTILLNGGGEQTEVQEAVERIRSQISSATSDYEKGKLQERLAKLTGGVAVIKVGGASEVEVQEKKDRITDALNATRAAVQEGIVPGGGLALLHASKRLVPLLSDPSLTEDQRRGVSIVHNAIRLPSQVICDNAGKVGVVLSEKMLQESNPAKGYDAATDQWLDFYEAGIIDPMKVVRTALVDSSSVSGLLITTEAGIVDAVEEETK
eukprot:TRINITY_DN1330_c0_g1_i1.p1 TRINITY_DN1330_c0_g1~~TRINITY_DN1330_c0_g1_i1.p1  ORF type:complete len:570 (+),score=148.08 TRINITY_DN1330_c0_g1_i1:28-1710(+)